MSGIPCAKRHSRASLVDRAKRARSIPPRPAAPHDPHPAPPRPAALTRKLQVAPPARTLHQSTTSRPSLNHEGADTDGQPRPHRDFLNYRQYGAFHGRLPGAAAAGGARGAGGGDQGPLQQGLAAVYGGQRLRHGQAPPGAQEALRRAVAQGDPEGGGPGVRQLRVRPEPVRVRGGVRPRGFGRRPVAGARGRSGQERRHQSQQPGQLLHAALRAPRPGAGRGVDGAGGLGAQEDAAAARHPERHQPLLLRGLRRGRLRRRLRLNRGATPTATHLRARPTHSETEDRWERSKSLTPFERRVSAWAANRTCDPTNGLLSKREIHWWGHTFAVRVLFSDSGAQSALTPVRRFVSNTNKARFFPWPVSVFETYVCALLGGIGSSSAEVCCFLNVK